MRTPKLPNSDLSIGEQLQDWADRLHWSRCLTLELIDHMHAENAGDLNEWTACIEQLACDYEELRIELFAMRKDRLAPLTKKRAFTLEAELLDRRFHCLYWRCRRDLSLRKMQQAIAAHAETGHPELEPGEWPEEGEGEFDFLPS